MHSNNRIIYWLFNSHIGVVMEKYKFNNIEYNLIKDCRDGFEEEIVKETMTDILLICIGII